MTRAKVRAALAALLLPVLCAGGWAAEPATLRILYIERESDPFYDPVASTDGVYRTQYFRPYAGAELGLSDVAALGRATSLTFVLDRRSLSAEDTLQASLAEAAQEGAAAAILDLPDDDMVAAARALPAGRLALFNVRSPRDELRRSACRADLFHIIPSETALTDAIAQFLVFRNWRRVLMLIGPEEDDRSLATTFESSARKFGARIVGSKPFVLGNNPRERQQTNVALMTAAGDFDAVFLADSIGDYGRFVPYRLAQPRPVVGSHGLQASAWHPYSERYGAPQVNRRFTKAAGRPMSDLDWSAWVAVKAVAEATTRGGARRPEELIRQLKSPNMTIEMSKGMTGSFRSWDHQLRQPIMIHTHNAVVEFAPLEGFLHQNSVLDTLGLSDRDVACESR